MWLKHSMKIAQQLILIYNTTVHMKKDLCCPFNNVVKLCHKLTTPTGHEGGRNKQKLRPTCKHFVETANKCLGTVMSHYERTGRWQIELDKQTLNYC